eukprot:GDKI01014500.1.p1 GENE.GDKI01014500.1~~GDKI01014500.1.p1  ORF type:complete len:339 (+),score=61.86 GDKI01014500.1:81-1097(+)
MFPPVSPDPPRAAAAASSGDYQNLSDGSDSPSSSSKARTCPASFGNFLFFLSLYVGSIFLGALLAGKVWAPLGRFIVALGPPLSIICYYAQFYGLCVQRQYVRKVVIQCMLICVPLPWVEGWLCGVLGLTERTLVTVLVAALVVGAVCVEYAKYLLFRQYLWKPHVIDPRALIFYGVVASNAFAAIESALYVFVGSSFLPTPGHTVTAADWSERFHETVAASGDGEFGMTAAMGGVLALSIVPLHTANGAMVGAQLAKRRFLAHKSTAIWTLSVPILLRGALNFALLYGYRLCGLHKRTADDIAVATVVGAGLVGFFLAWRYARQLDGRPRRSRASAV